MNTNISSLYEFTLQQMAAESYFETVPLSDKVELKRALIRGTNRLGYQSGPPDLNEGYPGYTRMTSVQADEFLSKYKIVHQWSDNPSTGNPATNTPPGQRPVVQGKPEFDQLNGQMILANTGLSATLILKLDAAGNPTNEYTLSIRSTEFRNWDAGGDGERDKTGADIRGIAVTGFALAQQDALEKYYTWLKNNTLLPSSAKLNVTGYSLGGNLATVFTEIHQGDGDIVFGETVTMNGAGRGSYDASAGDLKAMVLYYGQVLNDPASAALWSLDASQEVSRAAALALSGRSFSDKNLYGDARYQWALLATKVKFNLQGQSLANENNVGDLAGRPITQMFGFESISNTNFTANSGLHGTALRVGIESQPVIEGAFAGVIGTGDFGNGHSITLLADSLALQRAMVQLDPAFSLGKFIALLPFASNRMVVSGIGANYEADLLENVLDTLRWALLGAGEPKTEFKDGASGFGDIVRREGFFANLKELTEHSNFVSLIGKLAILPANGDIATSARTDFGALVALKDLAALYVKGTDAAANTSLAAVWQSARAADYRNWLADQRGPVPTYYSDSWRIDRAALLERKLYYGDKNATYDSTDPKATNKDAATLYDSEGIVWRDLQSGLTIRRGSTTGLTRDITFGSDRAEVLLGSNSALGDHLYGDGGADYLEGRGGSDYVEGGAGVDVYAYADGDGNDTIRDADGKGVVRVTQGDTSLLVAGYFSKNSAAGANVWKSLDNKLVLTKTAILDADGNPTGREDLGIGFRNPDGSVHAGGVTVKDFKNGDLNIHLADAGAPADPSFVRNIVGGVLQTGSPADDLGNAAIVPDTVDANVANALNGSALEDRIRSGGGDDVIRADKVGTSGFAATVGDWLQAGDGRDNITAGSGNDVIETGTGGGDQTLWNSSGGGDVVNAGAGNDVVYGDGKIALADAIALGDGPDGSMQSSGLAGRGDFLSGMAGDDTLVGTTASDRLDGGLGADVLIGGAGDDWLSGDAGFTAQSAQWGVNTYYADWDYDAMGISADVRGVVRNNFFSIEVVPVVIGMAGPGGADQIYAGAGNDTVFAGGGDDFIDAGSGSDLVYGGAGADIVNSGDGDDKLAGDTFYVTWGGGAAPPTGNDRLFGEAGDDTLYGEAGDDLLNGGTGNDEMRGDAGSDTYDYAVGDDNDTLIDVYAAGETNTLRLDGLDESEVKLSFYGEGYVLTMADGGTLTLQGNYASRPNSTDGTYELQDVERSDIQSIVFGDGGEMNWSALLQRGFAQTSTVAGATVLGTNYDDTLSGTGNATLRGGKGSDTYQVSHDGITTVRDARRGGDVNVVEFSGATTSAALADAIVTLTTDVTVQQGLVHTAGLQHSNLQSTAHA